MGPGSRQSVLLHSPVNLGNWVFFFCVWTEAPQEQLKPSESMLNKARTYLYQSTLTEQVFSTSSSMYR